jgi:hypothetical protein
MINLSFHADRYAACELGVPESLRASGTARVELKGSHGYVVSPYKNT